MSYVLTDGGTGVVTYPYSIGLLRRDNPSVSFPPNPTTEQLAPWNVYAVAETPQPSYHVINENLIELNPTNSGTRWHQAWRVDPATAQEIADRTAAYEASAAAESERLIAATDTYVAKAIAEGLAIHADLEAYRTAVANPASLSGYPVSPAWPAFPANIFDGAADFSGDFEAALNV